TQADLHRKLGSVFPPSVKGQTLTHRPHPRLRKKSPAVPRVSTTKPFRHENLNLLPQEFFSLISKHILHLCVDQYDPALPTHYDHCIRCGFQKPSEFLLRAFAFRNVAQIAGEARRPFQRNACDCELDGEFASVSTYCRHLDAFPQHSRLARGQVAGKALPMLLPERRWNDNVRQMLSQDFVPTVAEGVLGRRIELSDATFVIDRHNAVERRFQNGCLARLTALEFPLLLPEPLFCQSAFSKFFFECLVGGGKFGSPLRDPLIQFAGDLLLMAQEPCLLQPDRRLIRRHAQKKRLGLPRKIRPLSRCHNFAEFALQPQGQRHDRNVSLAHKVPKQWRPFP